VADAKFTLFDTPIGSCGIAWKGTAVVAVQLPEATKRATRDRMLRLLPDAVESSPPPPVRQAIAGIGDLLAGRPADLSAVELDMEAVPPFHRRVYEAARLIEPGETLTYGAIAARAGSPGSARAVGQALGRNPFAIIVPCHRVVAANGKLGGFSANGGVTTKANLLARETRGASATVTPAGTKTVTTTNSSARPTTSAATKRSGRDAVSASATTSAPSATKPTVKAATATAKKAAGKESAAKRAAAKATGAGGSDGKAGGSASRTDYGFDPKTALAHLRKADPKLGKFIDGAGTFDLIINPADSVFGMLAEAIIYQQLTAKAASTIFGRVCDTTSGGKRPKPKDVLATSHADLRAAGLSNAKTLALLDLAEKAESGELPTLTKIKKLPDDKIIEVLTKVRGVGRWTAEMFLIFRLGRPDVLPLEDYGLRRGYSIVFGNKDLPTKAELEKVGEKWAPYRTAASWYLWKAAEPPPLSD
jgi:methylated-DNA-[protein]-cysteine S-methyltransferase